MLTDSISEYLQAVVLNWWNLAYAVLFGVWRTPQMLRRIGWTKESIWAQRILKHRYAKPVAIGSALLLFVTINFNAFHSAKMEIKNLKNAASSSSTPKDPNTLYQGGLGVAAIEVFLTDISNGIAQFGIVTATRQLDFSSPFEFRNLTLLCEGKEGGTVMFGAFRQINYKDVNCRIAERRHGN